MTSAQGYLSGYVPQMILGTYLFCVNTAAFQEMNRTSAWNWVAQPRLGQYDALQYVGPKNDTISLPGLIYPAWRGGTGQLDKMRKLAGTGQPQVLLDAAGTVYGRYVIEEIDEVRSEFAGLGIPLRQSFKMALRYYDGGIQNALLNFLSTLTGENAVSTLVTLEDAVPVL